jgi:hypothetical protein
MALAVHIASLWFAVPLLLQQEVGVVHGWRLSRQAKALNPLPVGNIFTAGMLLFIFAQFVPGARLLGLVGIPMLGSLIYVAHRDIFLGQTENATEKVKESVPLWDAVPDAA